MNCELFSLTIKVSTLITAKNLFKIRTDDDEKQSGTKSRYINLVEVQVYKTIHNLNVCNLP